MEGGSLWHEYETDLRAADVWEVYGSLALGQLAPQLLPHVLSKVELVEGDGGVGTVLLVTFPPAGPNLKSSASGWYRCNRSFNQFLVTCMC
uniref:Uncharacterized protein n=1 Tax=Aegilops tauschii subsp. strangulata TaxID=200361 RepID=A0A453D962_AEGTS